jgi:hypothetical protein
MPPSRRKQEVTLVEKVDTAPFKGRFGRFTTAMPGPDGGGMTSTVAYNGLVSPW